MRRLPPLMLTAILGMAAIAGAQWARSAEVAASEPVSVITQYNAFEPAQVVTPMGSEGGGG